MIILFTPIFATISVIEDRQSGFLQGVLVAPGRRISMVFEPAVVSMTSSSPPSSCVCCLTDISLGEIHWVGLLLRRFVVGVAYRCRHLYGVDTPFSSGLSRRHECLVAPAMDHFGGHVSARCRLGRNSHVVQSNDVYGRRYSWGYDG